MVKQHKVAYTIIVLFFCSAFSILWIVSKKIIQGGMLSKLDKTYIDWSFGMKDFVQLFAICIMLLLFVILMVTLLGKYKGSSIHRTRKVKWWMYPALMLVILMCWMPYLLTFIPGGVWADTVVSIQQSLANTYYNHHPLLYTYSWKLIIHYVGTVMGLDWIWIVEAYVIVQAIMVSFSCCYMVLWMFRRGIPILIVGFSLCYVCCFNQYPLYVLSLWKDTPFSCWFIVYVCLISDIVIENSMVCSTSWGIQYTLISLLICFSRNNGIYIVLPTMLALILLLIKDKELIVHFLLLSVPIVIVYYIVTGPIYDSYGYNYDKKEESFGIIFQQIGYMVSDEDTIMSDEEFDVIDSIMPIYDWKENYVPYNADRIKWSETFDHDYFNENTFDIFKAYISLCVKNPISATKGYLLATNGFWDIDKQNPLGYVNLSNWGLMVIEGDEFNLWKNIFGVDISGILQPNIYISSAIFLWGQLFLGLILLGFRKDYIIPLIPGYAIWGTLLVATPIAFHHRYIIGIVFSLPIIIGLLFLVKRNE